MKKKWCVILSAIPLAIAVLVVFLCLDRLSQPDPEQLALYLGYSADETNGWSFETESGAAEPQLGFGGYFQGIAAEKSGPVAISRIMEDAGMRNLLEFSYYGAGIQVFLDDALLYTDFPNMENHSDAFLEGVSVSELGQDTLHISLPFDCAGKTLRVVTYGELWDGFRSVIFPSLVSRFSDIVIMTTDVAWDWAAAMLLTFLAIVLLLIFLMGAQAGLSSWKLLPLAVYFLLYAGLILRQSYAATAAGLNGLYPVWDFLSLAHIDCLLIFLAMDFRGWRRRTLLTGCGLHLLLSLVRTLQGTVFFPEGFMNDAAGLVLIVLCVVLMLFSAKKRRLYRWIAGCVSAAATVMALAWVVSRVCSLELLYPLSNPVNSLLQGDFRAFYRILCTMVSVLCTAGVVFEFIHDAISQHKERHALLLRSQMAQESYAQAVDSISKTSAMRHEWKNHITTLLLLKEQGKQEELEQRLKELDTKLGHLVSQHYSNHFTINTILQRAAARAEALAVRFDALAQLPDKLDIADGDLCSLMMNMLDNALDAAAQCAGEKSVQCTIRIKQGHLAIKCENSYSGALKLDERGQLLTTKPNEDIHGFGLSQMRAIAEKYGSLLDVSYTDDRFTVQTALKVN